MRRGESLFLLLVRLLSFVNPLAWFVGEDRVCRPGRPAEIIVNSVDIAKDFPDAHSFNYSHRQIPTMSGKIGGWNNVLALADYGLRFKGPVWPGSRPSLMGSRNTSERGFLSPVHNTYRLPPPPTAALQYHQVYIELEWMVLTRVQSYHGNTAIVHMCCEVNSDG